MALRAAEVRNYPVLYERGDKMRKTADVVVIGGGINGCCSAYYLARRGAGNVVLLEKGYIASGPTGRSSGIVRQHYTQKTLSEMARDSVKVWQNFSEMIGGDAGFVQCGAIFVCGSEGADALARTVRMQQGIGIDVDLLSADDLRKMEPELFADDIKCGAYELGGGYADPALAANNFCEAAQRAGVEVLKRTEVLGIDVEHGQVRAVRTNKGDISTRAVVNVAGVWGTHIAQMVGIKIPIKVSRHPVVILQRPSSWRTPTPVWVDLVTGWYFKPERNTGIMVGSVQDIDDEISIEDHSTVPSYEEIETFSAATLKRFPVMEEGLAQGGWAGLYDVTPDWQPIISAVPEIQGFYCAVGFSGHGFKIGPAVGMIVSDLVIGGRCDKYDINLFRYSRFLEKEPSRGAYAFGIIG